MEFKKVTGDATRGYAKASEVTKKDLKGLLPEKWIVASSAGLVTLMYSSKFSPLKIGVVFGCAMVSYERSFGILGNIVNHTMDVFYYLSIVLSISFILKSIQHLVVKRRLDDEKKSKSKKLIKCLGIASLISIAITIILILVLVSNSSFLFEKKESNSQAFGTFNSISSSSNAAIDNDGTFYPIRANESSAPRIQWKFGF